MNTKTKTDNMVQQKLENRFNELLLKLEEMESQLSKKADDIVTVQVLQHRNELEQAENRLNELERKIEILSKVDHNHIEHIEVVESPQIKRPRFFQRVASIFTL